MSFDSLQSKALSAEHAWLVSQDPTCISISFKGPFANRGYKHLEIKDSEDRAFVCTDADFFGKRIRNRPISVEPAAIRCIWEAAISTIGANESNPLPTQSPQHVYADFVMTASFGDEMRDERIQGFRALEVFDSVYEEACAWTNAVFRPIAGLWDAGSPTVFFNPHPKQYAVGDCVKRALVKITQLSYAEVSTGLNAIKRALSAKSYNAEKVTDWLINEAGLAKLTFGTGSLEESVSRFAEAHDGIWIVVPKHHWLALVDHVTYDSWDSANETVEKAYRVDDPTRLSKVLQEAGTEG